MSPSGFRRFRDQLRPFLPQRRPYRFDFAISFAGAQRAIASEIAAGLSAAGLAVFYDRNQVHELLGEDGEIQLRLVYSTESRLYIVLASRDYDQGSWTRLELKAIQTREALEPGGVLIPVLIDDWRPEWLSLDRIYHNLRESDVSELLAVLIKKARLNIDVAPAPARTGRRLKLRTANSPSDACSFEFAQFVEEVKKRLAALGIDMSDSYGPRSTALCPILECDAEDQLIALRVKAVIDTLLPRRGYLKGEIEGDVEIKLRSRAGLAITRQRPMLYL